MRSQHDTPNAGIILKALTELQSEIKPRTLPANPSDTSTEQFPGDALTILRRRNGDRRIGMQVVYVPKRQESMKGRIDGGRLRCQIVDAMVEQRHHRILLLLAVIDLFKALQSVDIQSR